MSLTQLSTYYFWSTFVVNNQALVACLGTPISRVLKLLSKLYVFLTKKLLMHRGIAILDKTCDKMWLCAFFS